MNSLMHINENMDKYDQIYLDNMAPALTAYVSWVIKSAKAMGIERLYFLARDGYSMYHIAQKLLDDSDIDMDIRYLHVSRIALRKAEYHLIGKAALDMICSNGISVTAESIMQRAGLSDSQARQILLQVGLDKSCKELLDTAQLEAIKKKLADNKQFMDYVKEESIRCYQDIIGYLTQEGLYESVKYGTVDCGWIGTLQRSLMHLTNKKFDGFYFGLYQTPRDVDEAYYHAFYFGSTWGLSRKVYFANCLFEVMVSAPEGMTIGYKRQDKKYIAIQKNVENTYIERQRHNMQLCLRYIDDHEYGLEKYNEGFKKEIARKLKRLMGRPTRDEVEALRYQSFCDDVLEQCSQHIVAVWDKDELKRQGFINKLLIKSGISKQVLHDSAWPEGSVVLKSRQVVYNLWQQRLYKYVMYIRMQVMKR